MKYEDQDKRLGRKSKYWVEGDRELKFPGGLYTPTKRGLIVKCSFDVVCSFSW